MSYFSRVLKKSRRSFVSRLLPQDMGNLNLEERELSRNVT
jgi:hypothetical protein